MNKKNSNHLTIFYKILRYFVVMMKRSIYKVVATALVITLAAPFIYGQSTVKHKKPAKPKQQLTIGLQTGRELLFNSSPLIHSRQSKVHYGISNKLVLRKPINNHFKIETGVNYTNYQSKFNNEINIAHPGSGVFSVPVTGQYYFMPERCKCHPYVGAGLQYDLNTGNNTISPFSDNTAANYQPSKKYVSVLFTQGMTYEINTKIEINESMHFLPNSNYKTIGIDMGIGYKLP
jgi:hypothetical protein